VRLRGGRLRNTAMAHSPEAHAGCEDRRVGANAAFEMRGEPLEIVSITNDAPRRRGKWQHAGEKACQIAGLPGAELQEPGSVFRHGAFQAFRSLSNYT
jgi:hypothetical protein